jgi:hypothetical protein
MFEFLRAPCSSAPRLFDGHAGLVHVPEKAAVSRLARSNLALHLFTLKIFLASV